MRSEHVLLLLGRGLTTDGLRAQAGLIETEFGCEADRIQQGFSIGDHLGNTLSVGDWNGDGIDDVLSAGVDASVAPGDPASGEAWLFLGNSSNIPDPIACIDWFELPVLDDFSPAAAFIGDIDGDGGDDIAIGSAALKDHHLGDNAGHVSIFLSDTSPSCTPRSLTLGDADLVIPPPLAFLSVDEQPHFGFSLARAGDVNGDQWPDLIVGAPGPVHVLRQGDPQVPGRAFVYIGEDPQLWATQGPFDVFAELRGSTPEDGADGTPGDRFGWAVAGVGNVDGDTDAQGDPLDDVVVSAPFTASIGDKFAFSFLGIGYAHL